MLKDKIKAVMLNQNEKSSKKKIENIVVFIIILIITVIAINSIWSGDKNQENKSQDINQDITKQLASVEQTSTVTNADEDTLEKRLESILTNIDGVGKVKVLITYSESSEVVAMYNENNKNSVIEEKDSGRWNTYYYTNRYSKRHHI